jgi:hypothetical protein
MKKAQPTISGIKMRSRGSLVVRKAGAASLTRKSRKHHLFGYDTENGRAAANDCR